MHPSSGLCSLTTTPAKKSKGFESLANTPYTQLRLIAFSQPSKIGLKKTPEIIEIPLGGSKEDQLATAQSLLGKEIPVTDVFKDGEYLDVIAVSKGKGWQGVVKRFGVALNPHKATAHRRKGGSLGAETQARIFFTIPRPGQMGYHRRTDSNKRILKISTDKLPALKHYGNVTGTYLIVDGSIPGPVKRLVRLRRAIDKQAPKKPNLIAIQA